MPGVHPGRTCCPDDDFRTDCGGVVLDWDMAGRRVRRRVRNRDPVGAAGLAPFAERQAVPGVDRAERRAPDVREYQPLDLVLASLPGDFQRRHVSPGAAGEADRPVPAGRVGEHEIRSGGPGGEQPELRCPHRRRRREAQQVAPRRVTGMDYRMRLDHQVGDGGGRRGRLDPVDGGQHAQLSPQLAAFVADQPGCQRAGRLGSRAAVDHDPLTAVTD
jgi:hypothetical protein